MELEEMIPTNGSFKLCKSEKVYKLRPFNLEDEIWLKKTFGDKIVELFGGEVIDCDALSQIAYHQLIDKSDFKKIEIKTFDDNGDEITNMVGGYKLLARKAHGMKDKTEMLLAINETLGLSRPEVKERADNAQDDLKKKDLKQ